MKKKIITGVLVLVLIIIGYLIFRPKKAQYETEDVVRTNLIQTVSVTGELKTDTEINLDFETSGRVKNITAKEGQQVATSDIIATIDSIDLTQEVNRYKALLDEAIANANINDDEINRLEVEYDNADGYYDDVVDLEDQKISAADQAVDDAQDSYDATLAYYNGEVSDHGANSQEARYAKISLENAQSSLNSAQENKETVEKQSAVNKKAAKNSKETAEENLIKAKSDNKQSYEDASVAAARAQYEIALNNLDKASLNAPVNGTISKVNFQVGEVLSNSTDAFAKMIASDFIIEAQVPESDIAKIKMDNHGVVTFDSLTEDDKFDVEVISIEPAATVIQDVVYYLVKFKLSSGETDSRLKAGMTANIDVETAKEENVLAIPERLIQEDESGNKFVQIINGKEVPERANVTTGLRADEGLIEIKNGLKEEDKIVTTLGE